MGFGKIILKPNETMLKLLRFYPFVAVVVGFFLPLVVSAAGIPYWGPLVACGGNVCTSLCDLVTLGQNLTSFGITLVVFAIAPIMIVYGGIMTMLSGGSPERMKTGKKIILNGVIGMALALGTYVILSTFFLIMGIATGGNSVQWPTIQCTPQG